MSEGPIDQAIFSELQETTGAEFVEELVATFLDEAPVMIEELKAAAAGSDAEGFRRAAHSIKSNANVFGASALAELARGLEIDGLGEASAAGIDALGSEFARTAQALRSALDG